MPIRAHAGCRAGRLQFHREPLAACPPRPPSAWPAGAAALAWPATHRLAAGAADGCLEFGLLLKACVRVVPGATPDAWTVRDRVHYRLVHGLLWPLLARGSGGARTSTVKRTNAARGSGSRSEDPK